MAVAPSTARRLDNSHGMLCALAGHRAAGGHLVSVGQLFCRRCGAYPI
jgi:hypothetical protein